MQDFDFRIRVSRYDNKHRNLQPKFVAEEQIFDQLEKTGDGEDRSIPAHPVVVNKSRGLLARIKTELSHHQRTATGQLGVQKYREEFSAESLDPLGRRQWWPSRLASRR